MRLTAVLTAALLALPAGPVAAQANQTGAFNVSFGGVRIGTLAFSGIERDGQYAVSGELQTAGLVNWFAQLRFDLTFVGASGIDRDGLYTTELSEASIKSAAIEATSASKRTWSRHWWPMRRTAAPPTSKPVSTPPGITASKPFITPRPASRPA